MIIDHIPPLIKERNTLLMKLTKVRHDYRSQTVVIKSDRNIMITTSRKRPFWGHSIITPYLVVNTVLSYWDPQSDVGYQPPQLLTPRQPSIYDKTINTGYTQFAIQLGRDSNLEPRPRPRKKNYAQDRSAMDLHEWLVTFTIQSTHCNESLFLIN